MISTLPLAKKTEDWPVAKTPSNNARRYSNLDHGCKSVLPFRLALEFASTFHDMESARSSCRQSRLEDSTTATPNLRYRRTQRTGLLEIRIAVITVNCECGLQKEVPREWAGKRAKCRCGRMLRIPEPAESDCGLSIWKRAKRFKRSKIPSCPNHSPSPRSTQPSPTMHHGCSRKACWSRPAH